MSCNEIIKDIIVPIISALIGTIGAYYVGIGVSKASFVKEEEKRAFIAIEEFEYLNVLHFSKQRNYGNRITTIYGDLKENVENNRNCNSGTSTLGFELFKMPILYNIDAEVKEKYNEIRGFYINKLGSGQESNVDGKLYYELLKKIKLTTKIENAIKESS